MSQFNTSQQSHKHPSDAPQPHAGIWKKTPMGPSLFGYGFRAALIGFLLTWSLIAEGGELQPVDKEGSADSKPGPSLQLPPQLEDGEPLAEPVTPVENIDQKQVETSANPGNPDAEELPAAEMGKRLTPEQKKARGESWTMLITSGPSRTTGTEPQREVVTFELDRKSGKMVGGPNVKKLGIEEESESKVNTAAGAEPEKKQVSPADYRKVYESIPYSRAEYLANPAYRHEATMEMLFGELRPTVIHKKDKPVRVYNQPQVDEGPAPVRRPLPWSWYGSPYGLPDPPGYFAGRYPYWTPNSTYRRYPTRYGPLFNRYYRPPGY